MKTRILYYVAGIALGWWMKGFMVYYKEHEET